LKYSKQYLLSVHQYSSNHKKELNEANECGCFYCLKTFKTTEITEWIDDKFDKTAICPKCGIDAILSEKHPIKNPHFLSEMRRQWF